MHMLPSYYYSSPHLVSEKLKHDRYCLLFNMKDTNFLGNAALKCYSCGGLSLEQCMKTSSKCRPEQNRCISLMLEGGNSDKIYYKRCGRKNECYNYKLQGTCDSKIFIHGSSSCRPACCETDNCNGSSLVSLSWLAIIPAVTFVLKILFS